MENFAALNAINLSSITALKIVRLGDDSGGHQDDNDDDEEPYNFTVRLDPAILTTIVVLFCIFCFVAIFSIFLRRRRSRLQVRRAFRRADVGNRDNWAAAQGLDRKVIESFPVFKYSKVKGLKAQACAVCLADFKEPEVLRLLPTCIHAFHPDCIDLWLFSHTTCPICRSSLLPGDDSDPTVALQLQATVSPRPDNAETRVSNRRDDEATNRAPSYDSAGQSLVGFGKELELQTSCNSVVMEPSTSHGPPQISEPGEVVRRSRSERWVSISVDPPSLGRSSSGRTPS